MINTEMARGWDTWLSLIQERRAAKHALRRGANAILHRETRAAFYRWHELLDQASKLRYAVFSLYYGEKLRAWRTWVELLQEWALESMTREAAIAIRLRAIRYLLNQKLSMAWQTWTVHTVKARTGT